MRVTEQEQHRGATKPGRHSRAKWFFILLFAAAALVLGSYLVQVYRCSRYEATGDALYDRYAQSVIARQKWRRFKFSYTDHPAYLPDNLLAEWEADFASDPRYWELRYWCLLQSGIELVNGMESGPTDGAREQAISLLEQARDSGTHSSNTLFLLHNQYYSIHFTLQHNPE